MLQAKSVLPIGPILDGKHSVSESEAAPQTLSCVVNGAAGWFAIQYGHVPPGAILLTRSYVSVGGKAVSALQSFVFDDEIESLWSHVGIMDSNRRVWDIMPDLMVRNLSLGEFIEGVDLLAIRALNTPVFDLDLLQAHIEDQAGNTYPSFAQYGVIRSLLQMMVRGNVDGLSFDQNELICSTFVDRILRLVSGIEILPEDRPPLILPGHFTRSSAFSDVPMANKMWKMY